MKVSRRIVLKSIVVCRTDAVFVHVRDNSMMEIPPGVSWMLEPLAFTHDRSKKFETAAMLVIERGSWSHWRWRRFAIRWLLIERRGLEIVERVKLS